MPRGYLALVIELHHRMPAPGEGPGEDWAETAAELYWPLLRTLTEATSPSVAGLLTIAVSPSWTALAGDAEAQARARKRLDARAEDPANAERGRWHTLRQYAIDRWGGDPLAALRRAAESGAVEVIPTTSSPAWLPGVADCEVIARAQVALAARDHASVFGNRPQGIWLPHRAFRPGIERTIGAAGLRYFGVDADAFRRGTVQPPLDVFGPLVSRPGVAAFGVDPVVTELVVDPSRRYARDERYGDPDRARRAAREHGDHFVERWRDAAMARAPGGEAAVSVAALSAHDLGGSWPSGIDWLERVVSRLAEPSPWPATTLGWFLDRHPDGALGRPGTSVGGWASAIPGDSADLVDRLQASASVLADVIARRASLNPVGSRVAARMVRSLLLAQSLDWAVPPSRRITPDEGLRRARIHLDCFAELAATLASGRVDLDRLAAFERGPAYLPGIDLADLGTY
jgi:1,4-alpha-glucan branching enzyme